MILFQRAIRLSLSAAFTATFMFFFAMNAANANVVGADAQNFNPTTNGLDFVTVQSSETLKPGIVNLGIFINHAVNSLPYYEQTNGTRTNFTDSLTSLDVNAGIGLMKNWDIGASMPQVLSQQVDDGTGTRGEFASTGITEFRLNTKFRFYGDADEGIAIVLSSNHNMISNNPYSGRNAGPTWNLELVADTTIERWSIGGNIGYRMRSKGTKIAGSIADPLGNQFIASAAASYHFPEYSTKVITEIFGAMPAETSTSFGDRSLSSFEWLVGLKHDINTNLAVHVGGGTQLMQGVASPDWRLYAGLNYAFGPLWDDRQTPQPPAKVSYLEVVPQPKSESGVRERFRTQAIHFEFDSDRMVGNYDEVLAEVADAVSASFSILTIEGHTDSVGPAAYNEALSLRRADAIKRRLVDRFRVAAMKVKTVGYGESRPIESNANYQGRQANRRVEFQVQR